MTTCTNTLLSFTNKKKVTDVWNSEVESMKNIFKMADFHFLCLHDFCDVNVTLSKSMKSRPSMYGRGWFHGTGRCACRLRTATVVPRPLSNDPRLFQCIYLYSHASKSFVEVSWCITTNVLVLCPYFTQTTNPQNHQESINVKIRLDSWRIVKFLTHSVMFYDPVAKRIRNSCEYSRDSAGLDLSRRDTVPNSLRFAKTCRNTARIDHKLTREYTECSTNWARINRNPRRFATIREIFSHDSYKKGPSMLRGHQLQNECSS